MSRVVTNTGTLTAVPSGVSSDHSYYNINNPNNAKTDTSSSTYAQIGLVRGSSAVTYVYFDFDTSSIPQNATITSVACSTKIYLSNVTSSNVKTKQCQLFSGTDAKGTSTSVTNAVKTVTLDVGSSWTRAELNNVHVRLYAVRGTSNTNTNYYFRFYGAELEVEYTYNEIYYTVTATADEASITVSPASQEYLAGTNATVTIGGDVSNILAEDNGSDVTASLVVSGSDYTYTIQSVSADHTVVISKVQAQGQTLFYKQNGAWVSIDKLFYKQGGTWKEIDTLYMKNNGSWES